jgi:uncharacterized membrane protein YhaH (DUF805 family)
MIFYTILFFVIPITSILCFYIKDIHSKRKRMMDILLFSNAFFYFIPFIGAFLENAIEKKGFDQIDGSGAWFWLYLFTIPITFFFLVALITLKIQNSKNK